MLVELENFEEENISAFQIIGAFDEDDILKMNLILMEHNKKGKAFNALIDVSKMEKIAAKPNVITFNKVALLGGLGVSETGNKIGSLFIIKEMHFYSSNEGAKAVKWLKQK